jgi:protein-tyrosine phosphatase
VIDLHSHVLPGIDDGPETLEGSLAIARRAVAEGIDTLLATPHVSSRYPNDAETIAAALERVRKALRREAIPLEVLAGAELSMTHLAELEPGAIAGLSLGGSGWLLVEPPFTTVRTGIETTVRGLLWEGHRVLLAHPERCPAIHRDPQIVSRLVEDGVLTSLTAGSLIGRFGSQARRMALSLLREGLAHNVASDAHDDVNRPPAIALQLAEAGYGELTGWLAEEVPAAILADAEIPPRPPDARSRLRRLWPLRR